MGFSNKLYSSWNVTQSVTTDYGTSRKSLKGTNITAYLNSYFGDSVNGAPLEEKNNTQLSYPTTYYTPEAFSHWEKTIFLNDLMTAGNHKVRPILSELTLIAMNYTNWYTISEDAMKTF